MAGFFLFFKKKQLATEIKLAQVVVVPDGGEGKPLVAHAQGKKPFGVEGA